MQGRAYVLDMVCGWKTLICRARSNYAFERTAKRGL